MSIAKCNVLAACAAWATLALGGCGGEPLGTPTKVAVERDATSGAAAATHVASGNAAPDGDEIWRGLERHEIQLDQKLLVVKGSRGVIGCPYLSIESFERFGEACAIIPAVDTAGMLDSKVTAVTPKAKELGIEVGMPGREALDKIR
jgi:uncharacterized protein YunC (DUF1805 family)